MPMTTNPAPSGLSQETLPRETPTCDETGAAVDMYAILILKALIDAAAFTETQAVTVDALHEITGIEVAEIRFLACQLAAPGFAVLEGPVPAISETAIKQLYIETDADRLLNFACGLEQKGRLAFGRADYYREHVATIQGAKHPWEQRKSFSAAAQENGGRHGS